MNRSVVYALRAICAVQFGAALGVWSLNMCDWWVCGAVATCDIILFLSTWPDPREGYAQAPAPDSGPWA